MPGKKSSQPLFVQSCVASVAPKRGHEAAFAICVASAQSRGLLKPGSKQITKKGAEWLRRYSAKEARETTARYEALFVRKNPANERPSLGTVLVVMGTPGIRGDVRMAGLSPTASLDEACYVLSAGSDARRRALRINALRALGLYVRNGFADAQDAARWLAKINRRLGVWAACSCVREALKRVSRGDDRPRIAIETAEAWVRGEATTEQVRQAYAAAANAKDATWNPYAAYAYAAAARAARAASDDGDDATEVYTAAAYAADSKASRDGSAVELRRLVTVVSERLVLFPEWAGRPSDDLWPMPLVSERKAGKR